MFTTNRAVQDNHIGVKFCWLPDRPPFAVPETEEIAQVICSEAIQRNVRALSNIDTVRAGVPLPTFWAIVKSANALKQDGYNWWRLDQSAKHLLASWILSDAQPKSVLAHHTILWEIFPTMIIGSEVEARIASSDGGQSYTFRADAEPTRGILFDWIGNIDQGTCIILFGDNQLRVEFTVQELRSSDLIRLIEAQNHITSTDSPRSRMW